MTEHMLPATPRSADEAERRARRLYPWLFVAFFVVVAAVNGIMIAVALDTFTGVTTAHPYEEGVAYNQTIAAARAQEKLGWQVAIDFAAADRGSARLAVTVRDRDGKPLTGAALTGRFIRPTREGFDSEVTLNETGAGRYEAASPLALPGQWDVVVTATRDGASYQKIERVFVPE